MDRFTPGDEEPDAVMDSVDLQEKRARELYEAEESRSIDPELHRQFTVASLFRDCRIALRLDTRQAAEGILRGIITERRLRRCEHGLFPFPPRAWQALAQELANEGRHDLVLMLRKAGLPDNDQMARIARPSANPVDRTGP